jgi:hypothetical protein
MRMMHQQKKRCVENENIITQSTIVASQPDDSDIQSIDSNSITRHPLILIILNL